MKNKSYIGISFIILVFGIIFIPRIIDRISNDDITRKNRLDNFEQDKSSDLLVEIGPVPSFELTDHNNLTISNKDYLGKVYVVEFFFSTCPTICPKMNQNMLVLENHFKDEKDFGIASITINPDTDTAEVLKNHAEHLGVTSPNWHFLTGDRAYIFEIANKGFNLYAGINPDVAGGFEHSGLFALIDKEGKIRSRKDKFGNSIVYYDGLEDAGIQSLKQDIRVLLNEN
uniref:SCO family protein n=1 Tax=Flavobacterium sp. TaxID=239 RepID=UPI00404A38F7